MRRYFWFLVLSFMATLPIGAATASNFKVTDNGDGTVTLSWKMSGSAGFFYNGYNVAVSRGTSPNQSASSRTLVEGDSGSYMYQQSSAGSVKDRPPATGDTYYYWLHYSDYSIIDDSQNFYFNYLAGTRNTILSAPCIGPVQYKAQAELAAPANVSAVTGEKPQAVVISWDTVDGAESYDVEYSSDNATFKSLPNFTGTVKTSVGFIWTLSGPDMVPPRYYRVIAKSSDTTSDPSGTARWQYDAPAFPSAVRTDSVVHSSGALKIAWDNENAPLPQGLWYTVYRKPTSGNIGWTKLGDTQDQSWVDSAFDTVSKDGSVSYYVQTGNGIYLASNSIEAGRKFGVFVGLDRYGLNDKGEPWCEPREHCVSAATGFKSRYLGSSSGGHVLCNSEATQDAVVSAIATCSASARPGDSFVYLHASHGIRYTAGGYAGAALYADGKFITPQVLGEAINGFQEGVSIAIILDSCYSGAMRTGVSLSHSQDVGWITSTSGNEISHSVGDKGFVSGGLVQSGWQYGCADSDGDGYVTLLELGNYAKLWSESALDLYNANPHVGDSGGVLSHMIGGATGGGVCPVLGSDLSVSATQGKTDIVVTWNDVVGRENYELYRKGADGEIRPIPEVSFQVKDGSVIFHDTTVAAGEEYTYYIKPYNAAFIGRAGSATASYSVSDELTEYVSRYWNPETEAGRQNGPYSEAGSFLPARLAEDTDGDGFSTYDEYVAGTNPTDPQDTFKSGIKVTGDTCTISWYPDLGDKRKYTVLGTEVLGGKWRTADPGCRFFKVSVELR